MFASLRPFSLISSVKIVIITIRIIFRIDLIRFNILEGEGFNNELLQSILKRF